MINSPTTPTCVECTHGKQVWSALIFIAHTFFVVYVDCLAVKINNYITYTLPQNSSLTELMLNPHFAPELEHLVIKGCLIGKTLERFMDMDIQPSSGGNTVKRRELIKDVIVLNYNISAMPVICSQDDSKVSHLDGFRYIVHETSLYRKMRFMQLESK